MTERDELSSATKAWNIGLYRYEPDTGIIRGSDVFCELHGIKPAARHARDSVSRSIHPGDRRKLHQALAEAVDGGARGTLDVTYRVVTHSGSTRWLRNRAQRDIDLPYIERRAVCLYGSVADVTDDISARTELSQAQARCAELEEQLRVAQRLGVMGKLVGSVAHDFNNILSVIMGSASLALSEVPDGAARVEVEQIVAASYQAQGLVSQLLDFCRGRGADTEPADVCEILKDLAPILRRLAGERVALQIHHDDAPVLAQVERRHIEQVLLNLVVNARDAMSDGGELVVECRTAAEEGTGPAQTSAVLEVRDSGLGMDAETQRRAFEPFFTTKGDSGTGLGLSTVHDIVVQSAGSISLASELGRGTKISVRLPGGRHV